MKPKPFFIAIIFTIIVFAGYAQGTPLTWRGSLETDHRLQLEDKNDWLWNENRLDLQLEKRAMPVRIVGNVWLRHLGPSITQSSSDLIEKDKINPWNLELREAYVEVYGFLSENLDLTVGRQIISWGTADRFNPTSNLNPPDLEDIFDFGRSAGIDAVNLQWHFSHSTSLQAVYTPFFRPANLPTGVYAGLFSIPINLPPGFQVNKYSDQLITPRNNIKEAAGVGARVRTFAFNTDISVSYVYGREFLPVPENVHITMADPTQPQLLDVHATLVFPRHHILGADLAGSIGRVGVWAEAALFFPEKETVMTTYSPLDTIATPMIEKKAFTKYVVGADYTFRSGTYLNVQYVRGFLHESGHGNLNDYLFVQTEHSFWQNRLRLQPLAGGISISNRDNPGDNYALFYTPEIAYTGIDNLEIALGGYFFSGEGDNLFAGLKDLNMIRLHFKASF